MIVTFQHLLTIPGFSKTPGFCRPASHQWFDAHGFNWKDFVANGIDSDKLIATGDAIALALVDWAREYNAAMREFRKDFVKQAQERHLASRLEKR